MRRGVPIVAAAAAVVVLVGTYLALGGASYAPTPVADPCTPRTWRQTSGVGDTLERVVLSALDGAACKLGVSREELLLALADDASLDAFAAEHGISPVDAERAVRDGLVRAVDDAETAGVLAGTTAALVRGAVERIPPRLVLDLLEQLRAFVS